MNTRRGAVDFAVKLDKRESESVKSLVSIEQSCHGNNIAAGCHLTLDIIAPTQLAHKSNAACICPLAGNDYFAAVIAVNLRTGAIFQIISAVVHARLAAEKLTVTGQAQALQQSDFLVEGIKRALPASEKLAAALLNKLACAVDGCHQQI